jgi:hypothetical protein
MGGHPFTAAMRKKFGFPGSLYERPCPQCGARPFELCVSSGGLRKSAEFPHRQRSADPPITSRRGRAKVRGARA